MDHCNDVATDNLFTACVKSPLKLDFFFPDPTSWGLGDLRQNINVLGTNKNAIRSKFKPSNNPTSAKFSDCNQVPQSCRLLVEATSGGEGDWTWTGQQTLCRGWLCKSAWGGKTLDVCDHKVIRYCERLVQKSSNRDKKGCCSLPFYQLSVAKVSLHNSLETRVLIWQSSTMNLSLDNPGHTHTLKTESSFCTQHI